MSARQGRTRPLVLGDLVAAAVAVAVIGAISTCLIASGGGVAVSSTARMMQCAARHQGVYKGFAYYMMDHNGVWIAPWDNDPRDGADGAGRRWPFTMSVYVAGDSIPDGEDICQDGRWWGPAGRGSIDVVPRAEALQCPTLQAAPATNPWWKDWTTMSYFIMGGERTGRGECRYGPSIYPRPELMTHPASTGLMMCQAGDRREGGTNAWVGHGPGRFALDPHSGQSNITFCDGHIETQGEANLYETMWFSMWERGDRIPQEPLPR